MCRSGAAGEARMLLLERDGTLTPTPRAGPDGAPQQERHGDAGEDEEQRLSQREGQRDHQRQRDYRPDTDERDAHVHRVLEGPPEPKETELEPVVHVIAATPPGSLKTPSLPSPR